MLNKINTRVSLSTQLILVYAQPASYASRSAQSRNGTPPHAGTKHSLFLLGCSASTSISTSTPSFALTHLPSSTEFLGWLGLLVHLLPFLLFYPILRLPASRYLAAIPSLILGEPCLSLISATSRFFIASTGGLSTVGALRSSISARCCPTSEPSSFPSPLCGHLGHMR